MSVSRAEAVGRLRSESFDLLVVGGGITGVGIAQDAAHRGLRVALVEKGDFGSGTTHSSTKLLHGGLRYLEQFQFRLMYEALHERNRLTRLAPALAEWLPFLIPIYGRGWSTLRIRIGLLLYDLLAGRPAGRLHRRVSREEALELAPFLRPEGLRGAFLYYDARTHDTRLTLAVLRSAWQGGAVAANYCEVTGFVREGEKLTGARVRDLVGGESFTVRARCVINATGVWADRVASLADPGGEPRLRPSKGVHLLVPAARMGLREDRTREAAVLAPSPHGDGRYLFVVPWQGVVLLGPTDTPYPGDPDRVGVEDDDVDYILTSANRLFPGLGLTREDIGATMAGLRPLIAAEAETTSQLSREHEIWEGASGLISIAGGKLTTYRTMAAEATDLALRRLGRAPVPCRTGELPLADLDEDVMEELLRAHPDLREPLGPGTGCTRAEVAYAAREEMAIYPEDFLYRRTALGLTAPEAADAGRGEVARLLERFGGTAAGTTASK